MNITDRSHSASVWQRLSYMAVIVAMMLLLAACNSDDDQLVLDADEMQDTSLVEKFDLQVLPPTPYPDNNPPRAERIALGRLIFFDPILGGEKDVACGTCHHPDFGFADGRQFGAGASGSGLGPNRIVSNSVVTGDIIELEPRNSPSIWNTGFNHDESGAPSHEGVQFWDGRVNSLEVQASKPITSRVEMRGDAYPGSDAEAGAAALDTVIARLQAIPEYIARFRDAYPDEASALDPNDPAIIDSSTYVRAIAAYERELVTRNSPFDRFVMGDEDALTDLEKEGIELFYTKAKCADCHNGVMFSDFSFIVQGVPQQGNGKEIGNTVNGRDDFGREEHTMDPQDRYAFRTPTLRNIELTAPYMHDGVFNTLEEVMHFYNDGAQPRHPEVTDAMLHPSLPQPLGLTDHEISAVVAFMKTLTDRGESLGYLVTVPQVVPSGLTPVFGVRAGGSGMTAEQNQDK